MSNEISFTTFIGTTLITGDRISKNTVTTDSWQEWFRGERAAPVTETSLMFTIQAMPREGAEYLHERSIRHTESLKFQIIKLPLF
jgi:hypothetical protein